MLNKKYVFLALVLILSCYIAVKKNYGSFKKNIFIAVFQQNKPVESFNNEKNAERFPFYYIDELNFSPQLEMTHSKLGRLGYYENLHVDAVMWIDVKVEGQYVFKLKTDSGIEMNVDDGKKQTFLFPDKINGVHIYYNLTKGMHKVKISKIHRGGPFILKAEYQLKDKSEAFILGRSSEYLEFIEPGTALKKK